MFGHDLVELWQQRWPLCPPVAHELKHVYRDRWVRFHSLPESRRYPNDNAEYDIVLHRYNTILDDLFAGQEVYLITLDWSDGPEPEARPDDHVRWHPDARYWTSVCDDSDPEFLSYAHLYASRMSWQNGAVDELLRAVADDVTAGVMITSLSLERIHHPYDGGADVLLPTTDERDALKHRHADWLSGHSGGL